MHIEIESTRHPVLDSERPEAPDLYKGIHKGLRHAMQANLLRLGSLDMADSEAIASAAADLGDLLGWLAEHVDIEERFVHAAIEQRLPLGLPPDVRHDHEHHLRDLEILRADCSRLAASARLPLAAREALGRRIYLAFARFVGENLVHMTFEETRMNGLLWANFTDDELRGIFGRIVASESPKQLGRSVRWIFPALSPAERAAGLREVRMMVEAPLFDMLLAQVLPTLSPPDAAKLAAALADEPTQALADPGRPTALA